MAKYREKTGAQHGFVPADKRQLQRQPDESEKAYRAPGRILQAGAVAAHDRCRLPRFQRHGAGG